MNSINNSLKKYKLNPFLIGLLYIEIILIVSHLIIPDFYSAFKAFLGLPLFFLFPYYLGYIFTSIVGKYVNIMHDYESMILHFFRWNIGIILILCLVNYFSQLKFWNIILFTQLILLLSFIIHINKYNGPKTSYNFKSINKNIMVDIILISIPSLVLWITGYVKQPFPLTFGDAYIYVDVALNIFYNQPFIINVGFYPLTLSLLFGIISKIVNVYPLYIVSVSQILVPFSLSLGIYFFVTWGLEKNRFIGILASFISIWTFNQGAVHYFVERTLLLIYLPFSFAIMIRIMRYSKNYETKLNKINLLVFTILFILFFFMFAYVNSYHRFFILPIPLILITIIILRIKNIFNPLINYILIITLIANIHIFEGVVFIVSLMVMVLYYIFIGAKERKKALLFSTLILILSCIAIILFAYGINPIDVLLLSSKDAIFLYRWDFTSKLFTLKLFGTELVLLIFVISTIASFYEKDILPLTITSWIIITAYFFPNDQVNRYSHFLNIFIGITISWFIYNILNKVNHDKKLKIIAIFFLLSFLMVTFAKCFDNNQIYIKNITNADNQASLFSMSEIEAAKWIMRATPPRDDVPPIWEMNQSDKYNKITHPLFASRFERNTKSGNTLIISDPFTMLTMEGLTYRDQPIEDRAWIKKADYSKESLEVFDYIKSIYYSNTSEEAYSKIINLNKDYKTILIIYSKRTNTWLKSEDYFILKYQDNSEERYNTIFDDPKYFEFVYENKDLKIYTIRNN